MRIASFCLLLLIPGFEGMAQHFQNVRVMDSVPSYQPKVENLGDFFSKGHYGGHFRYYFMATQNYKNVPDYYANGVNGALHFNSARFHGFEIGVALNFIFNVGSSDFTEVDSVYDYRDIYELQLFDVEDPGNKTELDRMEQLFFKYSLSASSITLGRMGIETPLINTRDTRMKPYVIQGVWLDFREIRNVTFQTGLFTHISPRSTVEWFPINEGIGVYAQGRNPDGSASNYRDHLSSKGLWIAGLRYDFSLSANASVWNYYIENISNTSILEVFKQFHLNSTSKLNVEGQYLFQSSVGNGGNDDPSKRYMPLGQENQLFTIGVTLVKPKWDFELGYLRDFGNGRYTFPREMGRSYLNPVLYRGRIEGLGDFHQFFGSFHHRPLKGLEYRLDLGEVSAPSITNFERNKYGNMSHLQFNAMVKYDFDGILDGLSFTFLYVHKRALENFDENIDALFYRANFHHVNLIADIKF